MGRRVLRELPTTCSEFIASEEDLWALDSGDALRILAWMYLIREF